MRTIVTIWVLSLMLLIISAESAGCMMWLALISFACTSSYITKKTKEAKK